MERARRLGLIATALAVTACYEAHGSDTDAAVDGSSEILDAGARDAGLDLRACRAPGTPECYCWVPYPTEDPNGRCITPFGDDDIAICDVGGGCGRPNWLCNDLGGGALRGSSQGGICVPPEACSWLRSVDALAICFYEDGTPFDTGQIADDACAASDRGVVCGPGCGGCASGQTCVGASERSGLGLCASGSPPDSPSRCGADFPSCPPGQACLGFILPADVTTVRQEQVWSSCVGSAQCVSLTMRYPDRFRCLE